MRTRQDEFEETALPHSRSLLRVARRLTSDAASAEDLVQETLLLAWRNFRQFEAGTNARAWLFQILFNSFYTQGRKRQIVELPGIGRTLSGSAITGAAEVSQALAALQEDHRTVLLLGIVEGFTCREMADILSVPIGTVMSRLSRAREALRTQLTSKAKCAEKGA